MTFSHGPDSRNLTLGQVGDDLLLRVRTPFTGPNGAAVEFLLPHAVEEGVATRVRGAFLRDRVALSAESEASSVEAVI